MARASAHHLSGPGSFLNSLKKKKPGRMNEMMVEPVEPTKPSTVTVRVWASAIPSND